MSSREGIKALLVEWAQEMAAYGWTGQPNMIHKLRRGELLGHGKPDAGVRHLPERVERMDGWLRELELADDRAGRMWFRACAYYGAKEGVEPAARAMGVSKPTYKQHLEGGLGYLLCLSKKN